MTEEDEAFNEIERRSKAKQEAVRGSLSLEEARQQIQSMAQDRSTLLSINPYRDQVIEEVAQHIEKLAGFSQELVSGLATYIREMKR